MIRGYSSFFSPSSLYRSCVEQCGVSGCIGEKCFRQSADGAEREQEPLFVKLARQVWYCHGECCYHCMLSREVERLRLGQGPSSIMESGHFAASMLYRNVLFPVMYFFGMLSFYNLVYKKLSLRPDGRTYYEYTILWLVYGILSKSSWFWSAVFYGW